MDRFKTIPRVIGCITMQVSTIQKPPSKTWSTALRYKADFYDTRYPICGGYLVYAVIGRKWVRVTQGDLVSTNGEERHQLSRFKMSLKEWEKIKKERFIE